MICGVALAAMSAAGFSHWWSVKSFVSVVDHGLPIATPIMPAVKPVEAAPLPNPAVPHLAEQAPSRPLPAENATQKKFFESLIAKMESLQHQNRDLLDQVAETNRDMMKLEFRVDTHSESFRPLPVNEERLDTSYDDGPGVLPPRAEPVLGPFEE